MGGIGGLGLVDWWIGGLKPTLQPTLRLSIKIPKPSFPQTYIPSFPRKWESRTSNFQIIFEYCRRPTDLDSRLRGNDGLEVARNLKKTETEQAGFPQHSVIPTTFRHSRESGNLEPQTFR